MRKSELKRMARRFRVLRGWKIDINPKPWMYGGVSINEQRRIALVSEWGSKREPKDYVLHEVLHCAIRALCSMDKRKVKKIHKQEELFVQDICAIVKDSGRHRVVRRNV